MKRKICVITGSRAEYGLLYWLLKEIQQDNKLELQLVVTGMHLSPEFGLTYRQIEKDEFRIDEKIENLLSSDTPVSISKSMGLTTIGTAEALGRLKPDILVVLGDRFEIFSAVSSAVVLGIPVAHIHGGEITQGAFDDAFRHSITKMSHIHFTSTEDYRKRVVQLGESPDRVFNVGAIGLDNIRKLKLLKKADLEKKLNIKFDKSNLLVTYHPVTLEPGTSKEYFGNLLSVLNELENTKLIFTKANADTDGRIINQMIDEYTAANPDKAVSFVSMGQLNYLSTMQFVDAVVGNSSSGIIEAPSYKIGTINIGERQKGRVKAGSVMDCDPSCVSIRKAFTKLFTAEFQSMLVSVVNPYDRGTVSKSIVKVLKRIHLKNILKKEFYDLPLNNEK